MSERQPLTSATSYGWRPGPSGKDEFWFEFVPCTREPKNWKEEIYAAARQIGSTVTKPLWLCSSGGIDSEVMCHAFFDQQIPFSVLTIEHKAGTNTFDT